MEEIKPTIPGFTQKISPQKSGGNPLRQKGPKVQQRDKVENPMRIRMIGKILLILQGGP